MINNAINNSPTPKVSNMDNPMQAAGAARGKAPLNPPRWGENSLPFGGGLGRGFPPKPHTPNSPSFGGGWGEVFSGGLAVAHKTGGVSNVETRHALSLRIRNTGAHRHCVPNWIRQLPQSHPNLQKPFLLSPSTREGWREAFFYILLLFFLLTKLSFWTPLLWSLFPPPLSEGVGGRCPSEGAGGRLKNFFNK